MKTANRRAFLKTTTGIAGVAALDRAFSVNTLGANRLVRLGLIGCGGRGTGVAAGFHRLENVEVGFVSDPDEARRNKTAQSLSPGAKSVPDLREMLEDKSVDGVIVATPDHWHTPASLLAVQAGKHVYVEKPCSHNVREGRLLVDAARKHQRWVQHGTQSRSSGLMHQGVELLRSGAIGDVLVAKAWNVQLRGPIGRETPSDPPPGVNYDLWVGPAPFVPFQKNRFHYSWHWWHHFGTGDMGNDGAHELDIARWGLGVDAHPNVVSGLGGKNAYDDDQEFPDTQYVSFEYRKAAGTPAKQRQLIWEMRLWSRYGLEGIDNGNAFYGTKGWMLLSKRGVLKIFDERNKEVPIQGEPPRLRGHFENFVDAIRGEGKLTAEIEVGHLSASLCHLGNVATRVGRTLQFDPSREQVLNDPEANRLLGREYRQDHWATPRG